MKKMTKKYKGINKIKNEKNEINQSITKLSLIHCSSE